MSTPTPSTPPCQGESNWHRTFMELDPRIQKILRKEEITHLDGSGWLFLAIATDDRGKGSEGLVTEILSNYPESERGTSSAKREVNKQLKKLATVATKTRKFNDLTEADLFRRSEQIEIPDEHENSRPDADQAYQSEKLEEIHTIVAA